VPELRPLAVGEIIDVALKIWRRHFWTLVRIVVVVVAPLAILSSLIVTSVAVQPNAVGPTGEDIGGLLAGGFTAVILGLLGFLLASAACLQAVGVAYLGGQPDWKESLRVAAGRFGSLLWLSILLGFGLLLAFILLVIPFFWLSVSWSLAFVVLVAEGLGGTQALKRSHDLVRGRWWPTFGVLALAKILQSIMGLIVGLPLGLLSLKTDPGSFAAFVNTAVSQTIQSAVTTPFFGAVLVLIYYDLRVRKEGFDLEVMARSIGLPAGDEGQPPAGGFGPPGPAEPPEPPYAP
jgi:hypothetical protein